VIWEVLKVWKTFRRLYRFEEEYIICDKHPYYESTKWALSQDKPVFQIQHHYAHALSVMFEHDLNGEYLAFVFDGTGYGYDGSIWGGEVLKVTRNSYERVHYLKPFKLIGGEKAIKNPANTAVALLDDNLAGMFENAKIVKALNKGDFPLTSSMGRVFDIVAFLGGFIEKNEWEGYSGLRIEKYYNPQIRNFIEFEINREIDFREILNFAVKHRGDLEMVASVFINSIVHMVEKISKQYNLPVILSGGVFQNKTLLNAVNSKMKTFYNKQTPINDANISVGQAAWGIWNLE